MLFPVIVGVSGLLWSRGKISIKEFFVLEGSCLFVLTIGFFIARFSSTADVEIWSGRITAKERVRVSCEHSYSCNPHSCNCDSKGNCSTCYDTCYEHSNDWDWDIITSNSETITIDRIDSRGSYEPPRWTQVSIGEATAQAHYYENYIKAHPESILRTHGNRKAFENLIPEYPSIIYDYYHNNRFITVGIREPETKFFNRALQEINADLGAKKKVNIIVVAVNTADSAYEFALEEAWIGGKKNDLVVILGVHEYPNISWVRIMSWTLAEELKVELRDTLIDIGSMKKNDELLRAIRDHVDRQFVHRHMSDFKYLMAGAQPGITGTMILFIIGVSASSGLAYYFYRNDPFECRRYG
ncbi:MAG: hypothetical protein HYT37_02405 [Candidatus Sungbacteria bacterium]|nr:hypothetical protein [Candidatus Sungbacteria bacterium]